jgi:hypothetical protein
MCFLLERHVRFSGLNAALNKEYDNLITFDLVCHGVPSPKLLESYLSFRMKSG